jgi:tRNA pseudouridine38-40 synthase
MRNLKLLLSYDGSDFAGWQVQPDRTTIQGTLAQAIGRLTGENVLPQGSGRTDTGVHALAQVASFRTASAIPVENWQRALNDILPASVRILEVAVAAPDFHARKSAISKTYRYRIHRAAICPPSFARYVWSYPYPLDEAAICAAAEVIFGEHDFTSFAAVDPERVERIETPHPKTTAEVKTTDVKTMNVRKILFSQWERDGDELIYTVRGNGFLHHMVRNLVGTFLLIGKGTLSSADFRAILAAKDRSAAGPTAPARGLYLVSVEYGN